MRIVTDSEVTASSEEVVSNPRHYTTGRAAPTEHLEMLPGGEWAVWRWVGLRGAGFPVELLLSLSVPRCAQAADEMNEMEEQEIAAHESALMVVEQETSSEEASCSSLKKAVRLLKKGTLPNVIVSSESARAALAQLRKRHEEYELLRRRFMDELEAGLRQISERICEVARRNDFREAVAWQNRQALQTGVNSLLRKGPHAVRGSKHRQHEQLVASYLQRYCAKNDTIGFFGPVGWARIISSGPIIQARIGPSLIAQRNLYFESWCIDSLIECFENQKDILPWLAPRRVCTMYEENAIVHLPFRKPMHLTATEKALLAACDGKRTANQIALEIVRIPNVDLRNKREVFDLLESLQARGVIWWRFELPRDMHPEIVLQKTLATIGEERLRAPLEQALDKLQGAYQKVKQAAGNAERVEGSLRDLEATFNELTGKAVTRSAGKAYAGRTLVYEDCMRDAEIDIGPELFAQIGPALCLILTSSRWLSYSISEAYRKVFRVIYAALAKSAATPVVDFMRFWMQAQFYFFDGQEEVVSSARAKLQKRWAKILSPLASQKRMHFSSESIKEAVLEEFAVPKPLGSFARYHSPDLLLAAESLESLRQDDYQAVLGELHASINTLGWPLFIQQHPSPQDLFLALERDLPAPRLVPIVPKGMFGDVSRVFPAMISPKDYRLGLSTGPTDVTDAKYVAAGSLVVEEEGGELMLRTRDGRIKFDLIEGLGELMNLAIANQFKMLRPADHLPRIKIDRLVVCRESWSFPATELDFSFYKEESDRYSAARKWGANHGLPRFVFVKAPSEDKPVYLDFESPIYVEIVARMVRRAVDQGEDKNVITITEMLPTSAQSWLPGASGEIYTCELRVVAVDLLKERSEMASGL